MPPCSREEETGSFLGERKGAPRDHCSLNLRVNLLAVAVKSRAHVSFHSVGSLACDAKRGTFISLTKRTMRSCFDNKRSRDNDAAASNRRFPAVHRGWTLSRAKETLSSGGGCSKRATGGLHVKSLDRRTSWRGHQGCGARDEDKKILMVGSEPEIRAPQTYLVRQASSANVTMVFTFPMGQIVLEPEPKFRCLEPEPQI